MSQVPNIEDLIAGTSDLPSIPSAVIAVIRESGSSMSSARSVAQCIAQDQALTARVLRLANSAYYGLPRKVSDIQEAVVVLGMRAVRNLALVASTFTWMARPLKAYGLGPKDLWAHSFSVGVCSELLARSTQAIEPETTFTAGLLHNLGKTVLSAWMQDRISFVARAAERSELPFDEVERRVLGYDHAQVGAVLAERWNLPESIVSAIRHHHSPDATSDYQPIVDCVHLADCFTTSLGIGLGLDGMSYRVSERAFERLSLDAKKCDEIIAECLEKNRAYETLLVDVEGSACVAA